VGDRFLTFSGGWWLVAAASDRLHHHWPILGAAVVLAAPVWWHGLRRPQVLPLDLAPQTTGPGWSAGEALYFFITPLLLGWAIHTVAPERFHENPGLVPLLVAIPYLLVGYFRPLPAFALVGAAAAAISGIGPVGWDQSCLGTPRPRPALACPGSLVGQGRWPLVRHRHACVALEYLFNGAHDRRNRGRRRLCRTLGVGLVGRHRQHSGAGCRTLEGRSRPGGHSPRAEWVRVVGGLMTLFGVTAEIRRFFELRSISLENATLAGSLAVSAWWLIFAAMLVGLGFRRAVKRVRVAGLTVAGLAVVRWSSSTCPRSMPCIGSDQSFCSASSCCLLRICITATTALPEHLEGVLVTVSVLPSSPTALAKARWQIFPPTSMSSPGARSRLTRSRAAA